MRSVWFSSREALLALTALERQSLVFLGVAQDRETPSTVFAQDRQPWLIAAGWAGSFGGTKFVGRPFAADLLNFPWQELGYALGFLGVRSAIQQAFEKEPASTTRT